MKAKLEVIRQVYRIVTYSVHLKRMTLRRQMRRAVSRYVFLKQYTRTERGIIERLTPVFETQVESMAERLRELGGAKSRQYTSDTAHVLVQLAFDPARWRSELIDSVLPLLAIESARAAKAQLLEVGITLRKNVNGRAGTKATTATQWLDDNPDDVAMLEDMIQDTDLPFRVFTEMPPVLKQQIARNLTESFQQPYWDEISKTTMGDAERYLSQGLRDGWSIRQMADAMATSFQGGTYKYAKTRATNIARTESANALNGGRRAGMDAIAEELGPEVPMRPSWLSVLGDTTRDSHALLDGVPADDEGMWTLSGYRILWPGHYSLPPGERCNCQCTITLELGMGKDEADRLIQEHQQRVEEAKKPPKLPKPKLPPPGPPVVVKPKPTSKPKPTPLLYSPAESVKEAEEWATGRIARIVDYTEIEDVRIANRINEELSSLKRKYRDFEIDSIVLGNLSDGELAVAQTFTITRAGKPSMKIHNIALNERYWKDVDAYKWAISNTPNTALVSRSSRGVCKHEFGHLLETEFAGVREKEVFARVYRDCKDEIGLFSDYTMYSQREMTAEMFGYWDAHGPGSLTEKGFAEVESIFASWLRAG